MSEKYTKEEVDSMTDEDIDNMTDEEFEKYLRSIQPPNVHQVMLSSGDKMIMFTTFDGSDEQNYDNALKNMITLGEIDYFQQAKEEGSMLSGHLLPHQRVKNMEDIPEQLREIILEHCDTFDKTEAILRFWEIQDGEWYPVMANL